MYAVEVRDRIMLAHSLPAEPAWLVGLMLDGRFMPLYSLMVATEPLPPSAWAEIGWEGRETVSDLRHLFFYAQRTHDDRIAIGGRGAPYRLGSPLDEAYERNDGVRARLVRTIAERFPAAAGAAITHHWGGPLGVPRDWCASVVHRSCPPAFNARRDLPI